MVVEGSLSEEKREGGVGDTDVLTAVPAGGIRPRGGFGLFWASQAAGAVGDRLSGFTAPTVAILVLGASDAEVGVVAAAGWLAYPAVGLLAGALLVRARVRRVVVGAELVRFTAFTAIALAVACGWITSVVPLVVAVALAGVATVFVDLGNQVQLPALVPAERLVGANSRFQSTDSASKLAGPALGGAAVGVLGPVAALVLGALPFLLSAFWRARVPVPTAAAPVAAPVAAPPRREPVTVRVREGLRFTCRHPVLGPLVTSGAVRALGTGAVDAVLLLFAYRVLGMSAAGTGLLLAAGAAGALVGVLCVGPLVNVLGPRRALYTAVAEGLTWCAVPLCLVLPAPVPVLFAIRVLSAVWTPTWGVVGTSVRQRVAPPERRGTVHGTTRVLVSSAIPLGSLAGGLAAGAASGPLGPPTALACVIVVGGLCIAGSAFLLPSHIPADRPDTPREDRCTRRPVAS